MNKDELVTTVAERTGMTKTEVRKTVDEVFGVISAALSKGEKFQYIGFGSFGVKTRKGRNGVNPRTHEKIQIEERSVAYFTPGKALSEKISLL